MDPYLHWLIGLISKDSLKGSYIKLLRLLHKKMFYEIVPNDQNRVLEGLSLRREYFKKDFIEDECSILEMLVAFSFRMSDIFYEFENLNNIECFWIMIDNISLGFYTDIYIKNNPECIAEIDQILKTFIYREYEYSGYGGLFPLDYPECDQTRVEIWYQFQSWSASFF